MKFVVFFICCCFWNVLFSEMWYFQNLLLLKSVVFSTLTCLINMHACLLGTFCFSKGKRSFCLSLLKLQNVPNKHACMFIRQVRVGRNRLPKPCSERSKKFRIKLSSIYLFGKKGFILEIILDFDPKILSFKKRESHPQINSALEWAHKCHSSSRSLHYWQRNGRSNYWKNQKNGRKLCWFASKCYAYCFFLLLT